MANQMEDIAEKALLAALGSGASPLDRLLYPQYSRELRTKIIEDGLIRMEIDKRGFRRYKRRYPWPKYLPPPISEADVRNTLNAKIVGFTVTQVLDAGPFIIVFLKECV